MENNKKEYLGTKYSEHVFGNAGINVKDVQQTRHNKEMDKLSSDHYIKQINQDLAYNKPQTLSMLYY